MKNYILKSSLVLICSLVALTSSASDKSKNIKLSNGSTLYYLHDASLVRGTFSVGYMYDEHTLNPDKEGVPSFLSRMLDEGPKSKSVQEHRKFLFLNNMLVNFTSDSMAYDISVTATREHLPAAADYVHEIIEKPKMTAEDFGRTKERVTGDVESLYEHMSAYISHYAIRDFFKHHPLTLSGSADRKTLESIKLEDIVKFHDDVLSADRAVMFYSGPSTEKEVKEVAEKWLGSKAKKFVERRISPPTKPEIADGLQYVVINKPGATDHQIRYMFPITIVRDNKDWPIAKVGFDLLGGGLHGRLGNTLRTQRGLTYHAGSSPDGDGLPDWVVSTFGGDFQVAGLLVGVPEVLAKFKSEKLTDAEVSESKERMLTGFREGTELPSDLFRMRTFFIMKKFSPTYLDHYEEYVKSIKTSDVKAFVEKSLNTTRGVVYLFGDKEKLTKSLKSAKVDSSRIKYVEME